MPDRLSELLELYRIGKFNQSSSVIDFAKELRDIYNAVPEDRRRYCMGDMDRQDRDLTIILEETGLGWEGKDGIGYTYKQRLEQKKDINY